jgi:hypothetical protein
LKNVLSEDISSALIGAVIGSVGATFISNWLSHRGEKRISYERVVEKYLLQLQDSVDLLWYRFRNLRDSGGRHVMTDTYFETTMLYALGKVFAFKHILIVEGVYANIERVKPNLGDFLKDKLDEMDKKYDDLNWQNQLEIKFYRYDRQTLAETIMQKDEDHLQTSTFLDFRKRYNNTNSDIKEILVSAREFIYALKRNQVDDLMKYLHDIADRLEKETGIKTTIKEKETE